MTTMSYIDLVYVRMILEKTRSLIEIDTSWIKGHMAQNRYGVNMHDSKDPAACRFCLFGAINRASNDVFNIECMTIIKRHDLTMSTLDKIGSALEEVWDVKGRSKDITDFNDDIHPTHKDVLCLIDRTIQNTFIQEGDEGHDHV